MDSTRSASAPVSVSASRDVVRASHRARRCGNSKPGECGEDSQEAPCADVEKVTLADAPEGGAAVPELDAGETPESADAAAVSAADAPDVMDDDDSLTNGKRT